MLLCFPVKGYFVLVGETCSQLVRLLYQGTAVNAQGKTIAAQDSEVVMIAANGLERLLFVDQTEKSLL